MEENKEKGFWVYFEPTPIYADDLEKAKDKAHEYMNQLPDDWIEISGVYPEKKE